METNGICHWLSHSQNSNSLLTLCLIAISNCCCSLHTEYAEKWTKRDKIAQICITMFHSYTWAHTLVQYMELQTKCTRMNFKKPQDNTVSSFDEKKTGWIKWNSIQFYCFKKMTHSISIYCPSFDNNAQLLSCLIELLATFRLMIFYFARAYRSLWVDRLAAALETASRQ